MAGRRLRDAVKTVLSSHKDFEKVHVVIAALSNAYSQYATTYEEYQVQRYEVSYTRHKPWSKYFFCISSLCNSLSDFNFLAVRVLLHYTAHTR